MLPFRRWPLVAALLAVSGWFAAAIAQQPAPPNQPPFPFTPPPGFPGLPTELPFPLGAPTTRTNKPEEHRPGFERTAWLLKSATIVAKPGAEPTVGDILIRDGLIVAVGAEIQAPPGTEVLELSGFHLYPGLIDGAARDLLDPAFKVAEPPPRPADLARYALAETRPDDRRGLTPSFDARLALKLSSEQVRKIAADGFTAVHIVPDGRISSGQGVLLSMRDAPVRELQLAHATGVEFRLFNQGGRSYPSTLMGATAHLRQAFADARRHGEHRRLFDAATPGIERPPTDPDWDALLDVAEGRRAMFWTATSRDDLLRVKSFLEQNELHESPILLRADDAHRVVDDLAVLRARVILAVDFGPKPKLEPETEPEAFKPELKQPLAVQQQALAQWEERVGGLKRLADHQIPFAITSEGLKSRGEILSALRTAIDAGLSPDAALAALTTQPAAILGLSDRLGTIEPGKFAHLVVTNGPLFDKETKIRDVFVDGVHQEVDAKLKPQAPGSQPPASPSISIAGTWNLLIENTTGRLPATLEIVQQGPKLTGSFRSEEGDGRIRDGSVDGNKVRWEISIGAGARELVLRFEGELADNKLTGTLKPPFGKETAWEGQRKEEPIPAPNPVELALDPPVGPPEARGVNDPRVVELRAARLAPTPENPGHLLLLNGTVMTGTGELVEGASILIRDGKIVAIGADVAAEPDVPRIDLQGRYVIPGIIDTHSHIKITGGINESTLSIVPEVRIKDAVNTDDVAEYRALAGGVTTIRILHGSANVIGGQDAVVKLKFGRPASEQILHDAPQGVKFALGENVKAQSGRFPNTRLGVEAVLQRAFFEALDYRRQWREYELRRRAGEPLLAPRRDDRLQSLADIIEGEKFIHSHCYRADEILMLLRVADQLGIRVQSLQHVLEGYKVAPEIVAHGASCSTFADWWAYKLEAFDAIPHNAALLHQAGANSVIKSDDAELIRHLYLEAAKTIRYGDMPEQAALQAITRNPARELGLDDRIGTLEVGKDADLAVFSGHPFNAFSRCDLTIIEGIVYFDRPRAPSAMSSETAARSAQPAPFALPTPELRSVKPNLTAHSHGRYALIHAHLHPVDAPEIPEGTLVIADGRIVALGSDVPLSNDMQVIDLAGLHVYPGLIDAGCKLGLTEIGRVSESSDFEEIGSIQPDLRAGVAVNPDSELIPVTRLGGVTTILVQPDGGLISGQASLVRLHGWTNPDMQLDLEFGLRIKWPLPFVRDKAVAELKEFLAEARFYDRTRAAAEQNGVESLIDPRFEAMRPYLSGAKPVLVEAASRQEIVEAVKFCEEEKLSLILTGAVDAWKVAKHLAERKIPVIVGPVMRAPNDPHDPFDAPYANAGRLHEAGIKFCFRSDHAANARNAPLEAAMAVAYGLPEAEALRAITLTAAEILRIDDELGSLTAGKRATLIITDGSPLQHTTQVHGVFVDGHPHAPASRQTRLYDKYRQRLNTAQEPVTTTEAAR